MKGGRWTGPTAVALVMVGLFATGAGLGAATDLSWPAWFPGGGGGEPPPREYPVLEPSRPVRIAIPAIGVRAPVDRVGLADDGSIAVPPLDRHNQAGWYDNSPTPGQFGPAVIVGHADTRTGPSIFHDVTKLDTGDRVEVTRRDGSVAMFEVTSIEQFGKAKLPSDRVYGDFTRPGLRLITCGGRWEGGSIGYADNIVVFATLVGARLT